jgi:GNAT superfamily N-acetyltransferase
MYIEVLWVHERCRGAGYGAQLMREAERTALARECNVAYLTTFSFQAPAFYASLGYRRLGKLQDMPPGASLDWLYKPLAAAGA